MNLIFVHGWSVTNTNTYGGLPEALSALAGSYGFKINIGHINLAKYVSFHDEVTVDDISKAMHTALKELPGNKNGIKPFSCITHSTGGPVVRNWIDLFYGKQKDLKSCPLRHLVMLAPANHGSTLAVLGKKRVGRIKSWFAGVEPGQRVLDWLSIGSQGQWDLNQATLNYKYPENGVYPFVFVGQGIDNKFYDFLNSYLVEPGSDGVVRVSGANMNYRYLSLNQTEIVLEKEGRGEPEILALKPDLKAHIRKPQPVPIGVFGRYSHSGTDKGIMRSVKKRTAQKEPIVEEILKSLKVNGPAAYRKRATEIAALTAKEQSSDNNSSRYSMLVLNIHDDVGESFDKDNFDVFLLYGPDYRQDKLPKGFYRDRQLNNSTNNLVYYVDADKMKLGDDGNAIFGVRIVARPTTGFTRYSAGEFRSEGFPIESVIAPNETTYIDITLKRQIDKNVYRFSKASSGRESFKKIKPSMKNL